MAHEELAMEALKQILATQKADGSFEPTEELALFLGANSVDDFAVPEGVTCPSPLWTTLLFMMILEEPRNMKYIREAKAEVEKGLGFVLAGLKALGIENIKEFAATHVGPVYANWSREPKVGRLKRLGIILSLQQEDGSFEESQELAEALGAESIDEFEAPESLGCTQSLWVTGLVAVILEDNWTDSKEREMARKPLEKMGAWLKAEVASQGVAMSDFGKLLKERVKDWKK